MRNYNISVRQFGIHALLVEWPKKVEEAILVDILQFSRYLKDNHLNETEWEFIPAYNSLTLVCKDRELDFAGLKPQFLDWYDRKTEVLVSDRYLWRLPVCYDQEFGIDLEEIALHLNLTTARIIELHSTSIYTVYGIGFLPGFMYLGGVPEALEVPRRATPRAKVLKGSVALAGKQTGVYPQDSPGGWNIIGSCSVAMFNSQKEEPCFVKVGDKIQFYPISKGEYQLHLIESEVGIYKIEKIALDA
ncbi:5-oxoprolinase subunit B [Arenibacter antarcticus]|uniref:5-oxoprolinase subunit PxpB n=1 Tax=Arenibacter antarcticus TaxID=2040469 RepID=A0ABW5VFQ8_9FLAO|nr:5-oxoprolinase subunit PxpB [Arenibacter sp. H213]MCM4168229.1 allophanate hydrolase subunit 1 [Arenibacter sp. H213]